jgi:polyhydroxybutyrate depolymerase
MWCTCVRFSLAADMFCVRARGSRPTTVSQVDLRLLPMRLTALLVVLVTIAGCAGFPDLFVPSTRYTFTFDGMERSYRVYRPERVQGRAPLVVVLHAMTANTVTIEGAYGWDKQADAGEFVVAYPEGVGWSWNAHGCCGEPADKNLDDVGFISTMIDQIPDIDRSRMFATGLSSGGMMAYALACNTDLFVAIGPVGATQLDSCPDPRPTSVMHVHGLADETVPFGGAPQSARPDLLHADAPPVNQVNEFWRRVDACAPPTVTEAGSRTTSIAVCPKNREVALITIDDIGHEWPPGIETDLWKFFAARG